jgi:asparagine synthase (glutamine-hydrolysing)
MCGIAGALALHEMQLPRLEPMLAAMAHRGPDGDGVWTQTLDAGTVRLGHRRLSIIDLTEAASQPMADVDGRYELVFNGEIYNYVELRAELQALGARFQSSSDSEVILEAYKLWGAQCLSRFNGMFAFAIWDRARAKLFCARDRFGEKPFLYVVKPGLFLFASEYKALLQCPDVRRDHDEMRLLQAAHNASAGLDSDRQTVFRDICQLLPGEALEIALPALEPRIWRYYAPTFGDERAGVPEARIFDEFRELLIDAVRIRMRSDVPVGSCLSGGLDSSAIVCIARQLLGETATYHTFTGQFPGTYADETKYALDVVAATRVENHLVEPNVERFIEDLPDFVWFNELPVGSSSQFAQWCVFHLAKQHGVTVLLDGQGSDELLGGYEQYFSFYLESLAERGDTARLASDRPAIRERYPLALNPPARALRDRLPFRMRHLLASRLGMGSNLLYGIKPAVAEQIMTLGARKRLPGFSALSSALAEDSFGRFLTTLLRYGDRNSMAHSREVRLPFCDHRLADFALSLPPHLLMGEIQTKRLLRESMRGILPESIRTRWNKQGFRPPQDLWFRSPRFLSLVRDTLSSASFRQSPYWIGPVWERMLDRVEAGELALGWTIWQPFMIEVWRRHFLARIPAASSPAVKESAQSMTPSC